MTLSCLCARPKLLIRGHAWSMICPQISRRHFGRSADGHASLLTQLVDGYMTVPDAPGVGPQPDWAELERRRLS